MKTLIVIPARYRSSRLPGKPLREIGGSPMIQRVYEQAKLSTMADEVIVATDDKRIADVVSSFDGKYVMTSPDHPTGTDRIIEVARKMDAENYINVQGDEPFVNPDDIDSVIEILNKNPEAQIATLCHPISRREAMNENSVKVVMQHDGKALYFSRSPIPFVRDQNAASTYYKHMGLYGYRREPLLHYGDLKESDLERSEKLEQLRFLQSGYSIYLNVTEPAGPSVDTESDLKQADRYFNGFRDNYPELAQVKLLISDADGVLSPAKMIYSEVGETLKQFHVRDGFGIKKLMSAGIHFAVVSGRGSDTLKNRLKELSVEEFRFQVDDKGLACREIMEKFNVTASETLFVGDDRVDLPAFETCGVSCAVADAHETVKARADIILRQNGGEGAIRELSDMILSAQNQEPVSESRS